jgi:hypothetical protein
VQTLNKITPETDRNWMLLFIDTDQTAATGWLGYDYVLNLEVISKQETSVKKWNKEHWESVGKAR